MRLFIWGFALGLGLAMASEKLNEEFTAEEMDQLLDEFNEWLKTNQGRFAEFYAEHSRDKKEPRD